MKLIETRIRNSITDQNLGRLIIIATEDPEHSAVNFDEVLEIFKQKIEELSFDLHLIIKEYCSELPFIITIKNSDFLGRGGGAFYGGGGGGGGFQGPPPPPPPLYEALVTTEYMYKNFWITWAFNILP